MSIIVALLFGTAWATIICAVLGRLIYAAGFRDGFSRAYWLDPYRYIINQDEVADRKVARARRRGGKVSTSH